MTSKAQLQQMREVDISRADRGALTELGGVRIDGALPWAERVEGCIRQLGNPYCFLCGGTPVKIRFAAGGRSLKRALYDYFTGLK